MIKNRQELEAKRDELVKKLSEQFTSSDRKGLQQEYAHINMILDFFQTIDRLEKEKVGIQAQMNADTDSEMLSLYEQELHDIDMRLVAVRCSLDYVLYPPNPYDEKSVFLEIRAGAGGQEAALFVQDLLRMYLNYAQKQNWHTSISSINATDIGGIKEVVVHIEGKNVYGKLKSESGVHRVQRVPKTESSGRVHTSTVTVAVLPEADEVDVEISPDQLRIDVYRASGAGGQHVNTTDSAVRITHLPTGCVVTCQDERSQMKNKTKAMKMLRSRLITMHEQKQEQELSEYRKELVGTGMRAEKIRTYNYPQNRVTDHQIGLTLKKLDILMEGEIDEIIDLLIKYARKKRKHQ